MANEDNQAAGEALQPPAPVPAEPQVVQDELDFGDEPEVAGVTETYPTVGQQAEYLLQAPEAENLSERDKAFLQQVARDMQETVGVLHRNPQGTYAPINDPQGGDRIVDSSKGEIKVSPGYRFRADDQEYAFATDPEVKYTNANLTHQVAQEILKRDKVWARQNIVRGFYEADDNYWKKA